MNNTGKIMTALAAGVAAGVIVGLLFAPDKGSETRKKINEQGKKFAGTIKDKFSRHEKTVPPSLLKDNKEPVSKDEMELAL